MFNSLGVAMIGMVRETATRALDQSALDPAGPAAAEIERLWWILFWICLAVFVVTLLLLALALRRRRTEALGNGFIIVSGIAVPSVILVVLLLVSLRSTILLKAAHTSELTIRVIGHQWWWEVQYPQLGIVTANELHIPVGEPVRIELISADVIHSFWVPRLHGKMDLLPDRVNTTWLQADEPGIFRGQCAEFCGMQHALMAFEVIALSSADFEIWRAARQRPAVALSESQQRGRDVFFAAGCNACHAVQETPAAGEVGPDLTHLASRRTIGAGLLRNNRGNLAGWISNPQPLKTGVLMPPAYLDPDELHSLIDYLESLE